MSPNAKGLVGRVIGGYHLERLISVGGMGAVFQARRVGTTGAPEAAGALVAVKVLVPPWQASEEEHTAFQARFRREAEVLQRLQHPHILTILDAGEDAGFTYMVLPFMTGGTLATWLAAQRGPVSLEAAARYLEQVATALDYAHSQGVVHRDIKPANVLLDEQGNAYLADFSIVRLFDTTRTTLTAAGQVLGTPEYMAPEQFGGGEVGAAADIYSLGIVLDQLVTGQVPFQGSSFVELLRKQTQDPPPPPRALRPDLPAPAEAVILRALAKHPTDRFGSGAEFAHAFQLGLRGQWTVGMSPAVAMPQGGTSAFALPPTVAGSALPPPIGAATPPPTQGIPPTYPALWQPQSYPMGSAPTAVPFPGQAAGYIPVSGYPARATPPARRKGFGLGMSVALVGLAAVLVLALVAGLGVFSQHLGAGQPSGTNGLVSTSTTGASTVANGKGCKHIAFLLPESATAARWEAADHPDVVAAIQKYLPGATIDVPNAQGNATTQQTQAESELAKGACILVVAPVDSSAAATIVTEAKAKQVPVIAYDRLIYSDSLNYYASFDGKAVGVAQGTYIQQNYQKYVTQNGNNNLIMIDGSDTDNNAHLFGSGAHSIIDPLVSSGALRLVYEKFTPGWDNATAQTEMQAALTANQNNVAVAYVANDGMANTVIAALLKVGLAGKVLVTGQDAEVAGIRNILLGYQSMTVYKPIAKLADSVGRLVAAISNGSDTTSIANQTVPNPNGAASIPSVLNGVVEVDISNIKTTVIADGFVSASDVCQGVPTGAGGIC